MVDISVLIMREINITIVKEFNKFRGFLTVLEYFKNNLILFE